ncbi:MFS transporter [Microbacterium sp.]|uniref:MFS transporter n=1 Tax=Microbacterium sp. TaxID=51671 RepID=UPI0025D11229|nr:MFS transporter [Microbacterium sp.]
MTRDHERERLPGAVWILSSVTFLTTMGYGVVGPALPALADLFQISVTAASIAISGFAAFRLIANVGFSGLLKRWRLRTVLFGGLILQSVSSVLAGLAPDGTLFLIFRSIGGLGSAALTVSATALLLALVPAHLRGRGMSTYFAASSLGAISGPAVGGFLAIANPRLPLIFYGIVLLCAASVAFFALRAAKDIRTADAAGEDGAVVRTRTVAATLLSNPLFIAALFCHFAVGWALYGVRTTTIPLHLGALGFATGIIGVLLTVGAVTQVVGSAAAGSASDRWGRGLPLISGLIAGMIAFVIIALTGDFTLLIIAFILMGLAGGALAAVPAAMLGDVPLGGSGLGVSLYWIAFDVAAIIGPLVSGVIADSAGFQPALFSPQIPLLLAIIASIYALRWQSKRAS